MNPQGYISKQDIANLDQRFDTNLAGLNQMIDRVLDKSTTLQTTQPPVQQTGVSYGTLQGTQNLQPSTYQNPYLSGTGQPSYSQSGQLYQSTENYGCKKYNLFI